SAPAAPVAAPAPGHVLVLVLPLLSMPPKNLPPGFNAGALQEMEAWLADRISPVVRVAVKNPAWQMLSVTVEVTFRADQPAEVYRKRLNEDLNAFISPWLYRPNEIEGPPN